MREKKLEMLKVSNFEYVLKDEYGKVQGIITGNYYGKDYVEIVRFCVASKYRSSDQQPGKGKYGRKLLNELSKETKSNGISSIIVVPKAEELFDNIKEMEINALYKKYEFLGFKFLPQTENIMIMTL